MIHDVDEFLIGIAFGVRYRANFAIEDQLGTIVDQILYSKNSYFNKHVFPLVERRVNEKVLIDPNTKDVLTINNSNIILEINFSEKFNLSSIDDLIENFDRQIIDGVLKRFDITEIARVGFIKRYLFNIDKLAKNFIKKTIGQTLDGVNDIDLKFSRKFPVPESLTKKNIYDYDNAIFNIIKRADKDELYISVDYQKYFEPFLQSSVGINFQDFAKKANEFNSKNYLNWLNTNYSLKKNE